MKTSFFKKGILAMGIACCMQLSAVENPVDYVNTLDRKSTRLNSSH